MRKLALILFVIVTYSFTNVAYPSVKRYVSSTGDIVIYDDVAHCAWLEDMSWNSKFYHKNYQEQLVIVSTLNVSGSEYYGLTGWHIATYEDMLKLVQNPLREITLYFKCHEYGNVKSACGYFTKRDIASLPNRYECQFTVCQVGCCEPYDDYHMPYEDLIEYPGPNNDIFIYAAPALEECEGGSISGGSTWSEGAWVVTSRVTLSGDNLVPVRCWEVTVFGITRYLCGPFRFLLIIGITATIGVIGVGSWFWYRSKKKSKIRNT